MENRLAKENCNKAKCKTCIFGPNPIQLTEERKAEIHQYLSTFQASHICHNTNLTCYGALEMQAKILFEMGYIKEPTVEEFLNEAKNHLKL